MEHRGRGARSIKRRRVGDDVTAAVLAWTVERLAAGRRVAVASVVEADGSVPGKPGARLAISDDGQRLGTVGGAGLELQVSERLEAMLAEHAAWRDEARAIARRGRAARGAALARAPAPRVGAVETYRLFKGGDPVSGVSLDSLCGGVVTVVFEVTEPAPHLLLLGGGHVAAAIAAQARLLDWRTSVQDTRPAFTGPDEHPHAIERLALSAEALLAAEDGASLRRFSHLLLLGHDWAIDETLLIGLLQRLAEVPAEQRPVVGVIGSRRKWSAFERSARTAGIEQAMLDAVNCPIGLHLGGSRPAEIAIAVLAEIIAQRAGQSPEEPDWRQAAGGDPA